MAFPKTERHPKCAAAIHPSPPPNGCEKGGIFYYNYTSNQALIIFFPHPKSLPIAPNGEEAASIISAVCRHIGSIIIIIIIIIIIGIINYYFGLTQFCDRPAGKGNLLGKLFLFLWSCGCLNPYLGSGHTATLSFLFV